LTSLEIRPVTSDDAGRLLEILGDPEVAAWLRQAGVTGPFTLDECEEIVARKVAHWAAHGFGMSLAFTEGRCVGRAVVQHTIAAGQGEVEIGWAVARDMWGRGIATQLGGHALSAGRDAGVDRIVAFTRVDNRASRRVMEKLGLEYERDFIHAGHPHVLYATMS
jgi:[ribosomal protein S5]-alanine N-acetyltransferase